MDNLDRRKLLKVAGTGVGFSTLAGCLGGDGDDGDDGSADDTPTATPQPDGTEEPEELVELHAIEPEGAITNPTYLFGIERGAWRAHNIDLSFEIAAFGKFNRQLVTGLAPVAGLSWMYANQFMAEGEEPMGTIGQQLNFYNRIMTKDEAPFEDVMDLENAHLGVPFLESQTTRVVRAMILDEFDFDILEDVGKVTSAPPPALWNLLQDDEIEVMLQFSGFTLRGAATDGIRTLFDPFTFWLDRTGQPPSVADFTVNMGWLEANAQTAINYLNGWWDAVDLIRDQTDQALTQYGLLGGIQSEEEIAVVSDWLDDGVVYVLDRGYPQELADSTIELMGLMEDFDLIPPMPDNVADLFITFDELQDMAM